MTECMLHFICAHYGLFANLRDAEVLPRHGVSEGVAAVAILDAVVDGVRPRTVRREPGQCHLYAFFGSEDFI